MVKLPTVETNLDMDFPTKLIENKKISDFVRAPEISHNDSVQGCGTTNKKSAVISEGSEKVPKGTKRCFHLWKNKRRSPVRILL